MISVFPTLYRTKGFNCGYMLFIRLTKKMVKNGPEYQHMWQRVTKLLGPIYLYRGVPFLDWPNMFREIQKGESRQAGELANG